MTTNYDSLSIKELKALLSERQISFDGMATCFLDVLFIRALFILNDIKGCFEKSELIQLLNGKLAASPSRPGGEDDKFLRGLLGAGPALSTAYQIKVCFCQKLNHCCLRCLLISLGGGHVSLWAEGAPQRTRDINSRGIGAAGAGWSCPRGVAEGTRWCAGHAGNVGPSCGVLMPCWVPSLFISKFASRCFHIHSWNTCCNTKFKSWYLFWNLRWPTE